MRVTVARLSASVRTVGVITIRGRPSDRFGFSFRPGDRFGFSFSYAL